MSRITANKKNHKEAWKHFWPEGNGKAKPGYCLHHVDKNLMHDDPKRYNQWNVEDLEMIEFAEHSRLHRTGYVMSEEQRIKNSEEHKGFKLTEEHKRKLYLANKGRKLPEWQIRMLIEFNKNRVRTDEERKKMGESQRKRFEKVSELIKSGAKRVEQLTLDGEHVEYYNSAQEAGRKNGYGFGAICSCCRGEKTKYKGFVWRYV